MMTGDRALRAGGYGTRAAHSSPPQVDWPTTLRFSRRMGEALRGADYAAAMEGPDGGPAPVLQGGVGLYGRLLSRLRRFGAKLS